MDKSELQHLVARQLEDILSQAERIISGNPDLETLESFFKYSAELKTFLKNNFQNEMILERANLIPDMSFSKYDTGFLADIVGYLLGSGLGSFRERMQIRRALEDIRTAQGYFSSIQFLHKGEMT